MTLQQLIESQRHILVSKKRKPERLISKAPDGTLVYSQSIVRNKSYYKWYVSKSSRRIYIPRKDRSLARELARKKLRLQQLKDVNEEQKCWRQLPEKGQSVPDRHRGIVSRQTR